ncbi:hypothetical protein K435DRAFT_61774 [Dendrothele bispora CBS 962.96]|uniref:Uncharacterized protein n=1 Tax=Dendrothele bispora (strain CBS 962.96) TaxID=1314807 RepID=A0A4V4HIA1_DENBC|nr:hypothetical protein K435DRAFT_61774 [Dendrothele bispora CBS 962.96]
MESPVTFPSSSPPKSSTPSHSKTRSRDLSFSELDPLLREQLKPNAHPYAIKTTSTALLSRSNSTSQRQIRHSYVPSSPVQQQHQQQQQQGPTRPQGHRKGSSSFSGPILGSPSPRPLPVPPPTMSTETGAYPSTGSPSPSPRRNRLKRADTLASPEYHSDTASTPFALGEETSWIRHHHPSSQSSAAISASTLDLADLPANPKVWTPSQLSAYLTTALRVRSGVKKNEGGGGGEGGGGDGDDLKLPVRVAQDIAAFVREKKINGRVFLRWEEGDLEGYGINKLWRTALLTSSRNLRQNVLRGRIWGFEDEVQELTSPAPAPGPELTTSSILDGSSLGRTSPGAPALPTLTPIPSTMYAPSAIHPSSGTFDENEMLGAAAAAVVPSAQVDGLPLSSSNDDHGPLPPARGHFDDNDTRSSPLNRSPTRSPPREQDSEEDEDDESTPNKNSSSRKSSPPSFTSASASDEGSTTTKNTLSKRPLPNPHSYISGTNARNAGSVRTRGVPLLTPESQSMFAAEGLDLEKLAEMDTFDDFLDSGLGLGVGGLRVVLGLGLGGRRSTGTC